MRPSSRSSSQARGYTPAASPQSANMIVQLGYGVDRGQIRYVDDPFGYGRRFYGADGSRFYLRASAAFGFGSAFSYGWDDPFWYGGGIDSYVEYHSEIDLHIRAAGTNAAAVRRPRPGPLADQPARRRSFPSLVEAMFTGFPGQSGEVVKITVPTRPAPGRPAY